MTYTVLIVDDSKLARMAVSKALNNLHPDWPKVEAANAEEAFALVRQSPPDFVLLDFNMPGKDGLTIAAELRDLDPRISVAVISANRQVEVIKRAEAVGAVFLPKPLTEQELDEFLKTAIQQHRGRSHG